MGWGGGEENYFKLPYAELFIHLPRLYIILMYFLKKVEKPTSLKYHDTGSYRTLCIMIEDLD